MPLCDFFFPNLNFNSTPRVDRWSYPVKDNFYNWFYLFPCCTIGCCVLGFEFSICHANPKFEQCFYPVVYTVKRCTEKEEEKKDNSDITFPVNRLLPGQQYLSTTTSTSASATWVIRFQRLLPEPFPSRSSCTSAGPLWALSFGFSITRNSYY